MARSGVRIADIFRESYFEEKVRAMAAGAKKRFGDLLQYDVEEELANFKVFIAIHAYHTFVNLCSDLQRDIKTYEG